MSTQRYQLQKIIRQYKDETGEQEVDMKKVAAYAVKHGMPLPKPTSAIDMLAKKFSQAAREETRIDKETGRPYRANHALTSWHGSEQLTLWIDIDEASRNQIHRSLKQRREQMVGDAFQLTLDADHWNSAHKTEEPIYIPLDFSEDVEERKNIQAPKAA